MSKDELLNWRPSHAYLPGKNARHAESLFDHIKAQVPKKITFESLSNCTAYLSGLELAADGFFWEAHEVLEPIWMAAAENSAEKLHIQALIQLANAGLKKKLGWQKAYNRLRVQAHELHSRVLSHQDAPRAVIRNYEQLEAQILQN